MQRAKAHFYHPFFETNLIEWHHWGEEAFEKAKSFDRLVFLHMGYRASRACASFREDTLSSPECIKELQDHWICVCVDKESNPVLDTLFQQATQVLQAKGGWPLSVMLDADGTILYAGIFHEAVDTPDAPGLVTLLSCMRETRTEHGEACQQHAAELSRLLDGLQKLPALEATPSSKLHIEWITHYLAQVEPKIDFIQGGLAGEVKFPAIPFFLSLWRSGRLTESLLPCLAVATSFQKQALNGLFDWVRGGFYRYSETVDWSQAVPEKALPDQAMALRGIAEMLLTSAGDLDPVMVRFFHRVLQATLQFTDHYLASKEGHYFESLGSPLKALDDTAWELWTPDAPWLLKYIRKTHDGRSFLPRPLHFAKAALETGLSEEACEETWKTCLETLKDRFPQEGTPSGYRLSSQALYVSGLSWAAQALRLDPKNGSMGPSHTHLTERAKNLFLHLVQTALTKDDRFEAETLDDLVFMSQAAIDLSRFTPVQEEIRIYIALAENFLDQALDDWTDPQDTGLVFAQSDARLAIKNLKVFYDSNTPSANSVFISVCLALAELTPRHQKRERYMHAAHRNLEALAPHLLLEPIGLGEAVSAYILRLCGPVLVSGEEAHSLIRHPNVFQSPEKVHESPGLKIQHSSQSVSETALPSLDEAEKVLTDTLKGLRTALLAKDEVSELETSLT